LPQAARATAATRAARTTEFFISISSKVNKRLSGALRRVQRAIPWRSGSCNLDGSKTRQSRFAPKICNHQV
jgi:hypothetical protein